MATELPVSSETGVVQTTAAACSTTARFSPKKRKVIAPSKPRFAPPKEPAVFVGKYSSHGEFWGLPTSDPVWVLLLEDFNKPSFTYLFQENLMTYLANNKDGYPKTTAELEDCGLFLCQGAPADSENVNQIVWQKGIYINGSEEDLCNAVLLLDNFFSHKMASSEFTNQDSKTVHILNDTLVSLDKTSESFTYPKFSIVVGSSFDSCKLHLMAAKPPGNNRPLKVKILKQESDAKDEVTLMVSGNTYPFRTSTTQGNYYKDGQVVDKQTGALWHDQFQKIKVDEAIQMLNTTYACSAMHVTLACNTALLSDSFIAAIRDTKNLLL